MEVEKRIFVTAQVAGVPLQVTSYCYAGVPFQVTSYCYAGVPFQVTSYCYFVNRLQELCSSS
jgi:hypothetical protein